MLTDNITFSMVEVIGMAVLATGMLIQLVYLISLASLIFRKKPQPSTEKPSISLIITSRNYAEELRESLPPLLEQNYPDFIF